MVLTKYNEFDKIIPGLEPAFGNLFTYHSNVWSSESADKMLENVFNMLNVQGQGFPKWESFQDESGNVHLIMALAGYPKESLSVVLNGKTLTVSCEATPSENKNHKTIARRAFRKDFTIGSYLDTENVSVEYKDGLLSIVFKPLKPIGKRELTIK